jgi:hypothetical protein
VNLHPVLIGVGGRRLFAIHDALELEVIGKRATPEKVGGEHNS